MSLYIDGDRFWLFAINEAGMARVLNLRTAFTSSEPEFEVQTRLTAGQTKPTDIAFLLGGISLLVADDSGEVSQWFLTRRDEVVDLERIRQFDSSDVPVTSITPEQRRKSFVSLDSEGTVSL